MIPRGRLDVGWSHLLFGMVACLFPGSRRRAAARLEADAFEGRHSLACLSVRSGFDALLRALALPAGSEVLVSALTIRDMVRIVAEHGLVAVPVDLDMETLTVDTDALERRVGARTKLVLVAHVFGAEMPLDGVADVARRHGLLLVEDRAQAFAGGRDEGHPTADVVLFSFGPIKTATALGGAVLRFRDPDLRRRVQAVLEWYPVQSRRRYLRRVTKYGGIKALSSPVLFGVFARGARLAGRSHDEVISAALRGFPGPELFAQIRQQPSFPLLVLLHRRLATYDRTRIARRRAAGERLAALLDGLDRPGRAARAHSHWVFPVRHGDPEGLIRHLWRCGFDATRGASSLFTVPPAPRQPETAAVEAERSMASTVYLPLDPGMGVTGERRLEAAVRAFDHGGSGTHPERPAVRSTIPSTGAD